MPTIISHAVVPLAIGLGLGRRSVPVALVGMGMVAAMLPDLDVIAFRLGIPYDNAFGHRGASHALFTAALLGLCCAAASKWIGATARSTFLFVFAAAASHGLLDTLTNGGHGIALLWPWSDQRFFAPFQPIEVSPIGISRFFSARSLSVLGSEAVWIWLPFAAVALAIRGLSKRRPQEG